METSKTILLVEDNLDDKILLKKFLSMGIFSEWEVQESSRLFDAIEYIQGSSPELILLDLSLPDSSGTDSFNHLKRNNPNIPIIVLTGLSDVTLAKDLIKLGAQDYLVKGDFEAKLLEKAIAYAVERHALKIENDRTKEKLIDSVLEAQDAERSRIAKELHDGVVQSLTAVSLNLGLLRSSMSKYDEKTLFHYEKCNDNLSKTIDEIRNISHSLMPRVITEMELVDSLESLIQDLHGISKLQIDFLANLFKDPEEKLKITIYRIVQELVNNVLKHSEAQNLLIQVLEYPEYISLMVEDDGKGFDKISVKEEKNCFGLFSLESRVNAIGGSIEIDSEPGRGTNIFISLIKSSNR